jgi:hypothetical protein
VKRTVCRAFAAAAVLAFAPAALAADAPHVQERIVPGASIGKVTIGMSLKQVRAVLGAPESVIRRERRSLTRTWVEYSWNFTSWRVAFEVYRGTYSVVSIRASVRGERTKEGVGYGTLGRRVQDVYGTQCKPAYTKVWGGEYPDLNAGNLGFGCVPGSLQRANVFFLVNKVCGNRPSASSCADADVRWIVVEYGVLARGEKLPFEFVTHGPGFRTLP